MDAIEYARMAEVERTYWWHVGRLEIIRLEMARQVRAIPGPRDARILNVGCGTGGTIDMLEGFGQVENVDVAEEAVAFARSQGFDRLRRFDGTRLPFPDNHFDLVGAFDVLEHIADDDAALREWSRVLRPGGRIVLTVPAYQWLWSEHDVALHHHRRYVRRSLVRRARGAGLQVAKAGYAIVFSLPLVVSFRLLNRLRPGRVTGSSYVPVPAVVNRVFVRLLALEARLQGAIRFPAGTSLLAVFTKPLS